MDEEPIDLDAKNVDDAAAKILDLWRHTQETKSKSFWFHGWLGLGASSVLRAIAGFLKSAGCDSETKNHFGRTIHIDCSLWKSRRATQKIIAQELSLHDAMPLFDKEDEDDDFRGVDDSSRGEITSIGTSILQSLANEKFLIVFQCGIDEYINLEDFGIPLKFGSAKLLWTNSGRFQLRDVPDYAKETPLLNCINFSSEVIFPALHEEAVEFIRYTGMDSINPDIILECYKYLAFLIWQKVKLCTVDYGWITHAGNYWVCDGILQEDTAWEIGDALHELLAPLSYNEDAMYHLVDLLRTEIKMGGWVSSSGDEYEPPKRNSTSYFLTEYDFRQELQIDSFQQAKNLRVLKLCSCSFDFSSPPFLCCQNLRFLWLDTCTDDRKVQDVVPSCFPNLWVFDLRFTEYVYLPQGMMRDLREFNSKGVSWKTISQAWKKLHNLHKLRVTVESSEMITVECCSPIDMMNLELLDLSGNTQLGSLPDLSLVQRLKMLVLDGCSSLEQVKLERAPMLEIFSFDGYGQAKEWTHSLHLPKQELRPESCVAQAKVSQISLEGCARLHSIFLRALPFLQELNLSETAIKRLDLGAMDVSGLKNLFLLGCKKLRGLLWDGNNPRLRVLHVDTRGKTGLVMCHGDHNIYNVKTAFLDGRFAWSVMQSICHSRIYYSVRVHISATVNTQVHIAKNIKDTVPNNGDSVVTGPFLPPYMNIHLAEDVADSSVLWDCRQLELLKHHLEIGEGSYNLERMQDVSHSRYSTTFYLTESLHVHDNSSITAIPPSRESWRNLQWCHVERCPELRTLFTFPGQAYQFFSSLVTFSAIDLSMAHCIWGKGINNYSNTACESLQHIYLNNCPRLVYVLPVSFNLPRLQTIQIEYCSNLKCIFPLDDKYPEGIDDRVVFRSLKRIKLRYLHNMEQICGARIPYAPELV